MKILRFRPFMACLSLAVAIPAAADAVEIIGGESSYSPPYSTGTRVRSDTPLINPAIPHGTVRSIEKDDAAETADLQAKLNAVSQGANSTDPDAPTVVYGTVKRIRGSDRFELVDQNGRTMRVDLENGARLREGDRVAVTGKIDHAWDGDKLRSASLSDSPAATHRRYSGNPFGDDTSTLAPGRYPSGN